MSISITFLGGLGEIGRNCSAIEIDGKLALVDCGLMFPEEDMLGVDLVFPDWSWILERKEDLECVILTHGHEDHVGALAYFLNDLNVPVYGTELSVELARGRIEELGVEPDLRGSNTNEWIDHGPFRFMLVPVSHSIPQGAGVAFDTPEGIVVHSGDFKLDPTPIDSNPTDLPTFAHLGRRGVRLLLADSTNAEISGFVPSERSLAQPIERIVHTAPGRVIAACFASHVHRVQQIADAALDDGRTIAFLGRSMHRVTGVGARLGVLDIPADRVVDVEDLVGLPADRQMLITTGAQGEPFAALSLMASGSSKFVDLNEDDTVLISATPIPGNERAVSRVISKLHRSGARVYHGRNAHVHVSGHAAQEELKTFINVIRPDAYVPIHGEYRHLSANADLAEEMEVPQVFVLEDGDRVVLDGLDTYAERRVVPAGYVYLDGSGVGDIKRAVLRRRRHLADEGVVVVTLGVDVEHCSIEYGPIMDSHGFMDEPEPVLEKAADAVRAAIVKMAEKGRKTDHTALQQAVRQAASTIIRSETSRRPVVLPLIMET